jgi:glycosyltransferase involved in cell wall biosynthesis
MHAGSWIPSDDVATKLGTKEWCKEYEESIFNLCDGIFVGSEFHKELIGKFFSDNHIYNKVHNTGLPFYPSELSKYRKDWKDKDNIVIFPHRLHLEKHPELFDSMVAKWKRKFPNWQFIKTMKMNLNKEQYYKLLGRSKIVVSYAEQENFGFSTLEAASLGCMLILPNKVVYPEFWPTECIYEDYDDCVNKVTSLLSGYKPKSLDTISKFPYIFEDSVERMATIMKDERRNDRCV